jgi:hypothetical protein
LLMILPALVAFGGGGSATGSTGSSASLASESEEDSAPVTLPARWRDGFIGFAVMRFGGIVAMRRCEKRWWNV